jgi:hypothetical protein
VRIDPHRLGRPAGPDVSTATTADAVRRFNPIVNGTAGDTFERLLRTRRGGAQARSLISALERATMPLIDDPTLLGESRSLEVLHYLLDQVLPSLEGDPETLETLECMLLEECDQQMALLEWLSPDPIS